MASGSTYASVINSLLKPALAMPYSALDLFAGCGGLSLGFEAAGFLTTGIEMKNDCCTTYNKNLKGNCIEDVLHVDYDFPMADIVIGGPPCQPFSVGGNQRGSEDARDGFPIFISAVKKLKPSIWIFENVRGLMFKNKWYLDRTISEMKGMGYTVDTHLVNFSKHGVPQNRERLIVVGHLGGFEFPGALQSKVAAGDAMGDLAMHSPPESKFLTPSMETYIAKYEKASKCVNPRDLDLSKPARTLTCRNLAGATGDMQRIKLSDGRRRRLLPREAARLQSFPDWFEFEGTQTEIFYQIGNAVPPYFAFQLAQKAKDYLDSRAHIENDSAVRGRMIEQIMSTRE